MMDVDTGLCQQIVDVARIRAGFIWICALPTVLRQ